MRIRWKEADKYKEQGVNRELTINSVSFNLGNDYTNTIPDEEFEKFKQYGFEEVEPVKEEQVENITITVIKKKRNARKKKS